MGARLRVHVIPNARKTEIAGLYDGSLKIRLQAQPVEGKANDALVRFLAEGLKLPRKAVVITRGTTGRDKVVAVTGLDCEAVIAALLPESQVQAGKS
ncbi:MAG TPA: DUF167 domain-containing protein [Burkholderiaceae bacterium]|jgi:hypothetical protein